MEFFQTVPRSSKVFVFPSLFHVSRLTRCVVGVLFACHKIVVRQKPPPPNKKARPSGTLIYLLTVSGMLPFGFDFREKHIWLL